MSYNQNQSSPHFDIPSLPAETSTEQISMTSTTAPTVVETLSHDDLSPNSISHSHDSKTISTSHSRPHHFCDHDDEDDDIVESEEVNEDEDDELLEDDDEHVMGA